MQRFFATTAKGMEDLLVEELRELGADSVEKTRAGASFSGDLSIAYSACLWSRTANRVLLPLKSFSAPNQEKLYAGVKSIRWSDHMSETQTLAVDFASTNSQINHTQFGALKVKDAVVDQFRSNTGSRPSVNTARPDLRINVYLLNDEATVSIDLSGDSLHKRGYRDESTPAPLKENLAAAILLLSDWPKISKENGACLVDPMCGSGTLLIEGAFIALNRAPGLDRKYYGFLGWKQHDPAVWKKLVEEAMDAEISIDHDRDAQRPTPYLPKIIGYDMDAGAVRAAIANVERAGLRQLIHVEKRELEGVERVGERGLIVVNPPYGERLGDVEELKPVYKKLGDTFKQKFKGWTGQIFTGTPELAKAVGLQASRRIVLFNGAIECRLLKYELY